MLRLLALGLVLIAPFAARAAPVEISLTGLGLSCSGGGLVCPGGVSALSLGGSLQADLGADLALTNVYGMISFDVIGSGASGGLSVTGGTIDLDADGDALGITTRLALSDGRTLWFADRVLLGPANSFDGTNLYLAGSTWRPGTLPSGSWLSVGLIGTVKPVLTGGARPIPEPTSFALLAAGGLLVGTALRKRD
jgi:hypothetical protein